MKISKDLSHLFGPARDQGRRPTCLVFAASDTHASLRTGWIQLSCEHLFHSTVKRSKCDPNQGVSFTNVLDVLGGDGQSAESFWPYMKELPFNLSQWNPPATLGTLYRRASSLRPASFGTIIECLNRGIPVVIGMTLSDCFYKAGGNGIISGEETVDQYRKHAVVGVGHGWQGKDKFVLIRNSWGTAWGLSGYAWVSQNYLDPRILQIAELKEDLT